MSKSKHTPGPWRLSYAREREHDHHYGFSVFSSDNKLIADCNIFGFEESSPSADECRANSALVAAAPDLLEALESIIATYLGENVDDYYAAIDEAKKAIAKAKGENHAK